MPRLRVLARALISGLVVIATAAPAAGADPVAAASSDVLAPLPPGGSFVDIVPVRVLDTRKSGGPTRRVTVDWARNSTGDPDRISAVMVNVTVVDALGPGYVQVIGGGGNVGSGSNGNFTARTPSASVSMIATRGSEFLSVQLSQKANVVVDLQGWVTSPEAAGEDLYTPIEPVRIADSRLASGLSAFRSGQTQRINIRERAQLPREATAVIANLTVARADRPTYITAWPNHEDLARPTVSNVNAVAGQVVANRVMLGLAYDGTANIYNAAGRTDLVVDVVGWIGESDTGAYFQPSPVGYFPRVADTVSRKTSTDFAVAVGAVPGGSLEPYTANRAPSYDDLFPVTAVWLGLAGDDPAANGYLSAGPGRSAPKSPTSDVNVVPGRAVANSGPVSIGWEGTVRVRASTPTRIVADLSGWFRRAAAPRPAAGVWTTYAPDYTSPPPVVSTRLSGLPAWFGAGAYRANTLGGGAVTADAVAPDGSWMRSVAGDAASALTNQWSEPKLVTSGTFTALAGFADWQNAPVYALRSDGDVLAVGSNARGALGATPSAVVVTEPVHVPLPRPAVVIGAARDVGYAVLDDGTAWSWGSAEEPLLGRAATDAPWVPRVMPGLIGAVGIAGDDATAAAYDADGVTYYWGRFLNGSVFPTRFGLTAGVCPATRALQADTKGLWALCTDTTATRLHRYRSPGSNPTVPVPGSGYTEIGASTIPNTVRLVRGTRVVVAGPHVAPYDEGGFSGVDGLGGIGSLAVTLVSPAP